MIKDGKYRYTLQFGMDTVEERQAGHFLEQLGNKKSPVIVAALNKYLEDNPGLLDSQVCVRVHVSNLNTRMLEDKMDIRAKIIRDNTKLLLSLIHI